MYGKIQRDTVYKNRLLDFICHKYALNAVFFTEAKRGFYGETWRLETLDRRYFVKLDYSSLHKSVFRDSITVVEHLCNHDINCIGRVIKTISGSLFTYFDSAVMGVFEWIDGENVQNEKTKMPEYQMLAKIYTVPANGIPIAKETFSTAYINAFYSYCEPLKTLTDDFSARRLLEVFNEKTELIQRKAERLVKFAERCKADHSNFYITHGDAGGNVIVNGDKFYIIDWDEPKLAPPERDAWFCMHWGWAMDAFHDALQQNNIEYTLNPDRLAFYCYHNFFLYLTEYLTAFHDLLNMRSALLEGITEYFDGWIKENLEYADRIQ